MLWHYDAPPPGETPFSSLGQEYQRDIVQCGRCGHCRAVHELPLERLYNEGYMSATYGDQMRATYERIMNLPPEKSDNVGRVTRLRELLGKGEGRRVLDVGSGLCVFLARMKEEGWVGTALDPDERAVRQAQQVVDVEAIQAEWLSAEDSAEYYDLISFNKVLEHVEDPASFLTKAAVALSPGGCIYIEVPDGETALTQGPDREEFFVEHWHMFSSLSLLFLVGQSGLIVNVLERLHEPSGKYTLRALVSASR